MLTASATKALPAAPAKPDAAFAAACAAVACTRFPLPLNPPQLAEVLMLMSTRGNVL